VIDGPQTKPTKCALAFARPPEAPTLAGCVRHQRARAEAAEKRLAEMEWAAVELANDLMDCDQLQGRRAAQQRAEAAEEERVAVIDYAAGLVRAIADHEGESLTEDKLAERVAANIVVRVLLSQLDSPTLPGYRIGACKWRGIADGLNTALHVYVDAVETDRNDLKSGQVRDAWDVYDAAVKEEQK